VLRIPNWPAPSSAPLTFTEPPALPVPSSFIGADHRLGQNAPEPGDRAGTPSSTTTAQQGPAANGAGGVSGAFSGLGGYMGKGLGVLRSGSGSSAGKIVSCAVASQEENEGEVLLLREGMLFSCRGWEKADEGTGAGVFVNPDGTPARDVGVAWPSAPDDIGTFLPNPVGTTSDFLSFEAFTNPYILSVLPSASSPSSTIQIRLASTLNVQQVIRLPQVASSSPAAGTTAAQAGSAIRCLTTNILRLAPAPNSLSGPVVGVYLSQPNDKLQLQTDGCTLWGLRREPWRDQVDEVLRNGWFQDGLGLVQSLRGVPGAVDKEDLVSSLRKTLV
jgi:hypothetical protein